MLRGITTAFGLLFLFLLPAPAYAWGQVAHIQFGRELLDIYRDFLAMWTPCVLEFSQAFLYGTIAPDRFLAKNLNQYHEHTHNWDSAMAMLEAASTEREKAFCLGYACHLAADVVAHNTYVPYKITERPLRTNRGHAYWELRFEHFQPPEAWELSRSIETVAGQADLDALMRRFQTPSVFSYEWNLKVTQTVMHLLNSQSARKMVQRLDERTPFSVQASEVSVYSSMAVMCMKDVLENGKDSVLLRFDPRGEKALSQAKGLSRAFRKLRLPNSRQDTVASRDHFGTVAAVVGSLSQPHQEPSDHSSVRYWQPDLTTSFHREAVRQASAAAGTSVQRQGFAALLTRTLPTKRH